MKTIFIGKSMYRITVRSKAKREKLAKIPEVQVDGVRVVFPEWLKRSIELIVTPKAKKKKTKAEQIELFSD